MLDVSFKVVETSYLPSSKLITVRPVVVAPCTADAKVGYRLLGTVIERAMSLAVIHRVGWLGMFAS